MLIWVCALHCEAKPVIDYYRLKKSHDDSAFDLYRGDNMVCIISGTGKVASAAACAWIAASHNEATSFAWINLGTAGCADHEIGAPFLLNQVIDADTGQRYYPVPCIDSMLPGCACLTLSLPSEDYRDELSVRYGSQRFHVLDTALQQCRNDSQHKNYQRQPPV